MFAVRQRYSGQSGVEQAFALLVFSLLQASQHALEGALDAGEEATADRPVNINSKTTRIKALVILKDTECMLLLYGNNVKMQSKSRVFDTSQATLSNTSLYPGISIGCLRAGRACRLCSAG